MLFAIFAKAQKPMPIKTIGNHFLVFGNEKSISWLILCFEHLKNKVKGTINIKLETTI